MSFVGVAWDWYARNREVLTAVGALLGGGLLTWGALQQPAFAALRLKERQDTHRPPGTTEVFSKAVDQLGERQSANLSWRYLYSGGYLRAKAGMTITSSWKFSRRLFGNVRDGAGRKACRPRPRQAIYVVTT